MAHKNYGRYSDANQFDLTEDNMFDDDVMEDVESVQEPYPSNEINENDDRKGEEVENPDENVHEYEDNDHPHEYKPPSANIADYNGVSENDRTNLFEQQNPLQSNISPSERDR